jgi:DNA (cytosine-5)-methyltransferase 1
MTMSKKKYKILNLYACLGGNRYKWDEVADNLEVTAVELDADLAKLYQERFPNDIVIVADAHQYLLDHYKEFDFIWSSPPCPSHSRARFWGCKNGDKTTKPVFADFRLYEEIMFLQHYFKGKYTVENVIPYYDPMIVAKKRGRHLYWTNFNLPNQLSDRENKKFVKDNVKSLCKFHNYDFTKYKGVQRVEKIARNLVDYQAGKTILETAFGIINREDIQQMYMFP